MYHDSISQCFPDSCGGPLATAKALVVLAQPYTLGCKAVPGCMANRYCCSTFYLPTHHGTNSCVQAYNVCS